MGENSTTTPAPRHRRIAQVATHIDRAAFYWPAPLRSALVALAAVVVVLNLGGASYAVPVGLGAFLVGLADQRGGFADRLRGMILATLLLMAATAIGLAVSDSVPLHIAAAAILGAGFGYVGIAGPRAAMAGVLALVAFAVFSGTPQPINDILPALLSVLGGAVAQIASVAIPLLARRTGGLRTEISISMRGVAFALRGREGGVTSTNAIAKIASARLLAHSGGGWGETRDWYGGLVDCTDEIRLSFLALAGVDTSDQPSSGEPTDGGPDDGLAAVRSAASDLLFACSRALEVPLFRRRIHPAYEAFEAAVLARLGTAEAATDAALRRAHAAGRELAQMLQGKWPIGRRAQIRYGPQFNLDWLHNLLQRRDPDQLFTRHSLRLGAAMLVATAIAQVEPIDHAYWLPVTVAWVAKPDLAGTAERVVSRIAGTVAGLIVAGLIFAIAGVDAEPGILLVFAAGVFAATAFLVPNYSICVAGWTVALLSLIRLGYPDIASLLAPRFLETLAGGLLVLVIAYLWPTRLSVHMPGKLAQTSRALHSYSKSILSSAPAERLPHREELMRSRAAAATAIAACAHEPGSHAMPYEQADAALSSLVDATTIALALDESSTSPAGAESATITSESLERLERLAERLDAAEAGGDTAVEGVSTGATATQERSPADFAGAVERAHQALSG